MTFPKDKNSSDSVIGKIIHWPKNFFRRFEWQVLKVDRTEIHGDLLLIHNGLFTADRIIASDIKRWTVNSEMVFDVIEIELNNGSIVRRTDKFNDLAGALRELAAAKEIQPK